MAPLTPSLALYALLLGEVIRCTPALRNIARSVTDSLAPILLAAGLVIMLVYLFAILAFVNFKVCFFSLVEI